MSGIQIPTVLDPRYLDRLREVVSLVELRTVAVLGRVRDPPLHCLSGYFVEGVTSFAFSTPLNLCFTNAGKTGHLKIWH